MVHSKPRIQRPLPHPSPMNPEWYTLLLNPKSLERTLRHPTTLAPHQVLQMACHPQRSHGGGRVLAKLDLSNPKPWLVKQVEYGQRDANPAECLSQERRPVERLRLWFWAFYHLLGSSRESGDILYRNYMRYSLNS